MKLSTHGRRVGKLFYGIALMEPEGLHGLSLGLRTTDQASGQGNSDFCHVRFSLSAKDLSHGFAAQSRNLRRALKPEEAFHRGAHHVVRVGRAELLREDVTDARKLEHRTRGAAGDDAGTFGRGL